MRLYKNLEKHTDERGDINVILPDGKVARSVMFITGKKGSERGNHYHKKDTHYSYVVEGIIEYFYIDKDGEKQEVLLKPGYVVYTPELEKHKFIFLTNASFIAMSTEARTQESYENDTVRENF